MKTRKILLPFAALFISALAFGQNGHAKVKTTSTTHHERREVARVNGSINANAHANENAQRNANENSVLNGTASVKTNYPLKKIHSNHGKRKHGKKKNS